MYPNAKFQKYVIAFSYFLRIIKVQKMFPLTDGAGYKLFGANIYPHPPWWGFLLRRNHRHRGWWRYGLQPSCAIRGRLRRTLLPCPVWTDQQTPPAACASGGAAPMHWGLGVFSHQQARAGYIPAHCLPLPSALINEG